MQVAIEDGDCAYDVQVEGMRRARVGDCKQGLKDIHDLIDGGGGDKGGGGVSLDDNDDNGPALEWGNVLFCTLMMPE